MKASAAVCGVGRELGVGCREESTEGFVRARQ